MKRITLHDVDLWETWIEFDHTTEQSFGTFYIIGEARLHPKCRQPFVRQMDEKIPGRLNLFLQVDETQQGRMREVIYAEPISNLNVYSSVAVYANGELLTEIASIEVLV